MKVTKLKPGNSIFIRLIVTFLIIIIPIYLLGIYIYNWGLNTVKNEISKTNLSQTSYYILGLEKALQRIKVIQYSCLNDEDLNKVVLRYGILEQYNINESLNRLQDRLNTIKNSSMYVKNVRVHIFSIKKTVSSNTGIDSFDDEMYQKIRVASGMKGAQIINYKNRLFLSTCNSVTTPQNPPYIIEVELDKEALGNSLNQFNTFSESSSCLVNSNNDFIINKSTGSLQLLNMDIISNILKEENIGVNYYSIENKGYYIVHYKSDYLNMVFIKYIPEKLILKPLQSFNIWVWVFSLTAIAIILIYSFSTYKLIHKPVEELVESFHKVENGDLDVFIKHDLKNEFGYLYKGFNDMVKNLKSLIDEVYNQKILMQHAELKQLQSQINPHFLYNSFFILNTMARLGDENLITFTKQLGEYFRFITRNTFDYISLAEEINHAKIYTEIQLMRFSNRLEIEFGEFPEKYNNLKVPRLILQPIIENAFEHGIEKKKSNGLICISFEAQQDELNIIVEDNGSEMTDDGLVELKNAIDSDNNVLETTGIINIHRRLKLIYKQKGGLELSRSELGGLKVVLKIKIPEGDIYVQAADC